MSSVKPSYENLISDIKNSLSEHLKESIIEMFIKADEVLFEMAESATSTQDQNRLFELMRDLRVLKDGISTDFISAIAPYLRPFAETEAEKKKVNLDNMDDLSLIGQAEMEDMVLIKSMGGNISGRFREQLSHLEARLEHLALRTPDIFAKEALQPINIFQAFDNALGSSFDLTNKKILFKFFNDLVALHLDKAYDAINNILIDAGILPQIKLHASKSPSARAAKRPPTPTTQTPADDAQHDPELDMNQGGYAMTAQPGHGYPGGSQNPNQGGYPTDGSPVGTQQGGSGEPVPGAAGDYIEGNQGMNAAATGQTYAGDAGGAPQGSSDTGGQNQVNTQVGGQGNASSNPATYQHITAGMPASQVGDVIGSFLGGAPMLPADPASDNQATGEGSQFFPVSTGQYYGHQEVLSALSNVQQNPAFSNADVASYDSEAIKQAVLAEIAKASGGGVTKRINRIAEKTIDFIELVFDAIIDDDNISDTIKTLLLRLQIPVIKASMIDQEFFIYDDHPARVLLDKIAHAGIGVNDRNDEIYTDLDKIVTMLVNNFELQADSFQIALDHLNTFLDEREVEALKKEEESQRQVLREHARNTVLNSLRTATRGKVLPETIHALVLKRWPTLMYNHYLKQGKENDEWINIIDTLRSIINSLQPLKTIHDLEHLTSTREDLIETTRSYLSRTNQSEKDIEQVTQHLIDIHQTLIDAADFENEPEQLDTTDETSGEDTEVTTSEESTEVIEPVEEEQPKLQLPSNIVPGMWFQIYNGEDKAQRRCKLSVVILEDQKMVFVNYQGEVIIEKGLGDFLDEIADGKSKAIMGHSIFDHALSSVVHNLRAAN